MDVQHARFLFEVQRAGERVAAECRYTPEPPRPSSLTVVSVRHTLALRLHRLAARLDVPGVQPA